MKNLQIGFLVAGQHSTSSPLSSLLGQTASDLASRDRLGGVVGLVLGLVGRDATASPSIRTLSLGENGPARRGG
jgi:hypothetical protein